MTTNVGRTVAGGLVVSQVVLAFLLSQPDVIFEPLVRVILGAASAGTTALALYLNVSLPGQSKP